MAFHWMGMRASGGQANTHDLNDNPSCALFGPTALIVQAVMGVLVIASLVYKRQRESPRRKWKIWMFDVSKQILGQAMLHGSNVFVSWLIGQRTLANPCVSYFLNILLDTTLGVLIIYSLLNLFTQLLTDKAGISGLTSGVYGDPPKPIWWFRQAAVYFSCLFVMKTIVIALIEIFPFFMSIGKWLLSWTNEKNYVQVIFVMGVFPIAMNILQFWLIDSIVKFKTTFVDGDDEPRTDAEAREPLVHEGSDDEDDENANRRESLPSRDIENGSNHTRHSYSKDDTTSISSAPTSSSSRTITARRRSPPPSPSIAITPSSSYGSIGNDAYANAWDDKGDGDERRMSISTDGRRSSSPTAAIVKRWETLNINMSAVQSPGATGTGPAR